MRKLAFSRAAYCCSFSLLALMLLLASSFIYVTLLCSNGGRDCRDGGRDCRYGGCSCSRISSGVSLGTPSLCAEPPQLLGRVKLRLSQTPSWAELRRRFAAVRGGRWQPANCKSWQTVAIVIPYRDRDQHLRHLLQVLHPVLQRQKLNYRVFVVEQLPGARFNRGALFNVGYAQLRRLMPDAECLIMHDADMLPESDRIMYRCVPGVARHMSAAISSFNYSLSHAMRNYFGGVVAVPLTTYRAVNGFSNLYFGWGGEEDDFRRRLVHSGVCVYRDPMQTSRYYAFKHKRDPGNAPNPKRFRLLSGTVRNYKNEGISSLRYKLHGLEDRGLALLIKVSLSES